MAQAKKQVKKKQAEKAKRTPGSFDFKPWLLAAAVAILTYIAFMPSLKNEFTNWDDPTYVTENPMVQNSKTQWSEIFSKPVSLNYHPLTMLTLAWNYQSAEKHGDKVEAKVFHAWNVWIHLFNTLLVFYFIWLLSGRQLLTAAFTAAIFGLHPMHVESVSWVAERKDVLYTFFFVLSCIAYLHYIDKKKMLYLVLSFLLFGLSCLSKAMAVVIPLVFIAIDYFKGRKWNSQIIIEKIPFLLLSLYIGIKAYTIQATDAIAKTETFTLFQRLMFGSYGALMYLAKFFVPVKLSAFYPYPTTHDNGIIPVIYYVSPLVWVALGLLAWLGYKKYKAISFGIAFFIITIVLVLQFLSVGSAIMADRYSYIPYIGIAFILGSLGEMLIRKYSSGVKAVIYISLAAFAVFLSTQTYSRAQVWKTSETLWTDVINKYPEVEVAYKNRGNYYGKEIGDLDHSYKDYMVLKHMNSKDTKVYSNMGNVYGLKKQVDSAVWAYNKAIQLDPNNDEAYVNRGITYSMTNQYDKAIEDYNKAEQLRGVTVSVLQNRAYTYFAAGKYQQSVEDYNKLLQLRPYDGIFYYYRGMANEQLNNNKQALQDLQAASSYNYKVDAAVIERVKIKAGSSI